MKPGTFYSPKQSFALLLVGEPKSGKTNVAMSFPKPFFLDLDRNLGRASKAISSTKQWFFGDPHEDEEGKPLDPHLKWPRCGKLLKEAILSPDVETIVVDGLGVFSDMLMAYIVHERSKNSVSKDQKPEWGDYMRYGNDMTAMVMLLRSSKKMIVYTSHQKVDKDELTGRIRYELNMVGKLSNSFGGLFSDVWACTSSPDGIEKVKYEIWTGPTGLHINLGTSIELPVKTTITGLKPEQIWALVGPKVTK